VIVRLRPVRSPTGRRVAIDELERHLMRCRRREEAADVLTAEVVDAGDATRARLAGCFRLTDSVDVRRARRAVELTAVFDADGLDRDALERRLLVVAGDHDVRLGWARFPDDGLTLQALREVAR
jgi:hypothetical protein